MSQRTSDRRGERGKIQNPGEHMSARKSYGRGVHPLSTAAAHDVADHSQGNSDDTVPGHRHAEQEARSAPTERAVGLPVESIRRRLERVERQNRWMRVGFLVLLLVAGYAVADKLDLDQVVVRQTLLESRELKLLDNDGNARLFIRMYSRVPVLQVMDGKGKPRMSLGLRFDDTPFIDLSDKSGRTRATFEMTDEDTPALRLLDESGTTTFRIN